MSFEIITPPLGDFREISLLFVNHREKLTEKRYIMDKRLSGRFYFEDLLDFGETYSTQASATRSYDLQVRIHSY